MSDTGVLFVIVSEELLACRACLATDVQLEALRPGPGHLADIYVELTGIQVLPSDGLPQHLCSMCAALLRKSAAFRDKCRNMHDFLQGVSKELQWLHQPISMSLIRHLDRKYLKLPYSTTDVLTVSILGEVTNANEYVIPVKQETQIEVEKEDTEDDCVLIEDCSPHDYIMLDGEPIEQSIQEELFTDFKITETENASAIANNDNTVPKLKRKCIKVSVENERKEYLINSKEKTSNIHKRLFCNYVLDKYFYKTKESGGVDKYDMFDINTDEKDTIVKTVDNSFNVCVISAKGNTLIDDAELNKNMFFNYIREKYVNKKNEREMRKIVNVIRQRIKNFKYDERLRNENRRKRQESRNKEDLEFTKIYNFDIIRMTRNEQILELEQSRKNAVSYQQLNFKCEECFRGFSTETLYKKHMTMHDPISGRHVCEVCKQRFSTSNQLGTHVSQHRVKYICRQCKRSFSSRLLAREHYQTHEGLTYQCPHCGVMFRKNKSRLSHIQIHHGAMQCEICYEGFQGARGVLQHKAKAHKQTYHCASCNVHFNDARAILRHIGPSPDGACDPNIRACAKCGERFENDEQFDEHVARLHGRTREKQRKQREQKHVQYMRSKCCTCPNFERCEDGDGGHKVTINEYNVPNSVNVPNSNNVPNSYDAPNSDDAPNGDNDPNIDNVPDGDLCPCSSARRTKCLCPTGSVRSCGLTEQGDHTNKVDMFMRHKWAHKGCCKERRLMKSCVMCEVCAAVFPSQTALRSHQRVHTGEKPFQCNECPKRFRVIGSLQTHMYTHTGERPYKCSLCPKTFNNYVNRRRHRLVHTNERRHRCEVCDKTFKTSWCVKLHVRTVHMKMPQPPCVRTRKRKCE